MRSHTNIALAGLLAASLASAQNSTVKCASGLKMFVSRGTGEEMGPGVTEALVDVIAKQINGSDYEAILYPASFDNPSYFVSVANGTNLVRNAILDYTEACPNSKIALFGYSQVFASVVTGSSIA
jgi:acetylxylan esterase